MRHKSWNILLVLTPQKELHLRIAVYGFCLLLSLMVGAGIIHANRLANIAKTKQRSSERAYSQQVQAYADVSKLRKLISSEQQQGVDVTSATVQLVAIDQAIQAGNFTLAESEIALQTHSLIVSEQSRQDAIRLVAASQGVVKGIVTDGTNPLASTTVNLMLKGQMTTTETTDPTGVFSFTVKADTYSLTASLANYASQTQDGVVVIAQGTITQNVVLTLIPPPTPAPTPTAVPTAKPTPKPTVRPSTAPTQPPSRGDSTAYSSYQHTTISASSGTFTADIMTFDLGSGHIRVVEDTANDDDCTDGCAVKSVMSYVQQNGGFAGINGSYFCPTAYGASCAGKTNSFYWKQYNSRLQKMINPDNTLGEQDPFIVFTANGHATFLRHWVEYGSITGLYAGISCAPAVVLNGQYAVDSSTLDDKQRTSKVARAAIGLKGQTLYVVTIQGATVGDLGQAMVALSVDNAMNIDAGGSSGMVYNNSYKLGPGRAVPNALVFKEL